MTITPGVAKAVVVLLSAAAVVVAAVAAGGDDSPTAAPIRVDYVFSTDATTLLTPLIARFNAQQHLVDGRPVKIVADPVASGEAESALVAGTKKPALWTPASKLWGSLLDYETHRTWASDAKPLVLSPQVIAMWKPMAEARGYPKPIGWTEIFALASRGWGAFGHEKEFGPFLLGHTNPDISTSGMWAVTSEYYAATRKTHDLTLADTRNPRVRSKVREIEHSIVHYARKAEQFLAKMDLYGTSWAHAVYVQETVLNEHNKHARKDIPLVAIEPKEGTFVADYPLIQLRAPWVDATTGRAARAFAQWLPSQITARSARDRGFRLSVPASLRRLEPPTPQVLVALRSNWRADRKPANIALVVDTSSSMAGRHRLDAAKTALLSFIRQLAPSDQVALVTSGSRVEVVPFGRSRAAVKHAVRGLSAVGELPVYPAISQALDAVRSLKDPRSINAVVVLSDGASDSRGYKPLLGQLRADPVTEGTSVRVFTVAYGDQANGKALETIARLSRGEAFPGAPSDVREVYERIGAYF